MEDRPSAQSFSNHHQPRHRPSFPVTVPSFHNSQVEYPSTQPAQGSLEAYGSRGEESATSFLISNASPGSKRGSIGADRVFLNAGLSSLDGDTSLGGHLDGDNGLGSHFDDSWYGTVKKEVWDDGESCESPADEFPAKSDCYVNTNDVFYTMNCASEEGVRHRARSNYNNYAHVSCEAKSEAAYSREANISHFTKQTTSCNRNGSGSFNDSGVEYCRTDSRVSEGYLGREEDYGSSCGSGEDQIQPAEVDGHWLSISPSSQEGRWRGAADGHNLASGCLPQRSLISINSRTYTQKLDSFSEAFLSQRKRRYPGMPGGDSSGPIWEYGIARGENPTLARQSCAFDTDSYIPPSSSSSSPGHPSLPSFPSPPTSSHLMSSVLSPPPTPLPPPSHSPSKMDSPSGFAGTGHSVQQGGEPLGTVQFFTSRLPPVPSVHPPGMLWKFPLLSHCFPQSSGDPGNTECSLRSSHGDDYGNTAAHKHLQSPESLFPSSSSHHPSVHPSRALCASTGPPLQTPFHFQPRQTHVSGQRHEAVERIAPCIVTQKVKNGPASVNQAQLRGQATPIYTGKPFPSVLQSGRGQKRSRYTPRPLLNPVRTGMGLYSSVSSLHHRDEESRQEEDCGVSPCINVGPDFQADLPPFFADREWSGVWLPEEESPREQLLWKPWHELEDSANSQDQVEKLLSMCSSSCLPGGGSNTELALYCLNYCQGNTMATLEMLLFSQPSPTGDYHYSGCDAWTDTEKSLFNAALGTCGKDFTLIEKMVRTKTVRQCVEFYYLSKKLLDKQKKQKEEESREGEVEQQKSVTPICQPVDRQYSVEEAVPVPSLASFFPCKLCGKMFYKIKSRNAHMKIHRQPQEDWSERRLQHQLLTQRLALTRPANLIPAPSSNLLPSQPPALTFPSSGHAGTPSSTNGNANDVHNSVSSSNPIVPSNVLDPSTAVTYSSSIAPPNCHLIANVDTSDSHQREPASVLPFHPSWGSFGQPPDPAAFYCNLDGKEEVGAGTVPGKETINWQ
ncbi:uncharacterized protein LOC125019861 isoform X2 [Mugil cephalus]|nr:uncharacterized protein LOC125019861 isoform X2 [Mugil cephalus]XP_047461046.1 uncharacterized protein LOC125019861 isoform X2 [Mugil cephalus]